MPSWKPWVRWAAVSPPGFQHGDLAFTADRFRRVIGASLRGGDIVGLNDCYVVISLHAAIDQNNENPGLLGFAENVGQARESVAARTIARIRLGRSTPRSY
jgi:hypothetical protein